MSQKHELQDIIRGNGSIVQGANTQAAAAFLGRETATNTRGEDEKYLSLQEVVALTEYIDRNQLWFSSPDESKYLSEGAEQKVYEDEDPNFVIKYNSRVFYASWIDYFYNLLLHNYFFPYFAYELIGFCRVEETLCAVVRQPFARSNERTDPMRLEEYLSGSGFIRQRNNDYICHSLGIILEDLHDENVLSNNGLMCFVDTAFFLTDEFHRP